MTKKTCVLLSLLFISCGILILAYSDPKPARVIKAAAIITPTAKNTVTGKIILTQEATGVRVVADCKGLTPGKHGIHIHEFGHCDCDGALCAGAHFNPTNKPHGGPQSPERHVGDFGNLEADELGVAHLELFSEELALNGKDSVIGRSIIIHAQEDDLTSQPSGNSGDRIGCGVIGISEVSKP